MVQGLIDFLTSGEAEALTIIRQFVFKIVPMLNPDGVIVGNSRTDIIGKDMDKQFESEGEQV